MLLLKKKKTFYLIKKGLQKPFLKHLD